jgi:hypothetical protein
MRRRLYVSHELGCMIVEAVHKIEEEDVEIWSQHGPIVRVWMGSPIETGHS